jgi:4a-hydroxytetrahydrobiopterin dehydratase
MTARLTNNVDEAVHGSMAIERSRELLTADELGSALSELHPGWSGSPDALTRSIEFADFSTAVEFVNELAPACEERDHHPDLALRWRWVDVVLSTHSAGGVTRMDVGLAQVVDEIAATLPQIGD